VPGKHQVSATWSNRVMPTVRIVRPRRTSQTLVGRRARDLRIRIGADIRQMREDSGATQRELSDAAGIDHGYLSLIERGLREPSITALTAIATALGADASIRLYPGAGPRLRDPIQARITEALLRILHPRWDRMLEVPVIRPARGFIDVVILDRPQSIAICTEIQSELRRLEQLLRWANEKALALPSALFWDRMGETPRIDRLLVVRSTRSNREIATRSATPSPPPTRAPPWTRTALLRRPIWPGASRQFSGPTSAAMSRRSSIDRHGASRSDARRPARAARAPPSRTRRPTPVWRGSRKPMGPGRPACFERMRSIPG